MTDEYRPRNPLHSIVILLILAGGGWYFLQHYQIAGLDGVSIRDKPIAAEDDDYLGAADDYVSNFSTQASTIESDRTYTTKNAVAPGPAATPREKIKVSNLRIGSWAISGLDVTKLSDETTRANLVRIIRQFDLIAVQQVAYRDRDLLPRLTDLVNEGDHRYEYMMGDPTGPTDQMERFGLRVRCGTTADRSHAILCVGRSGGSIDLRSAGRLVSCLRTQCSFCLDILVGQRPYRFGSSTARS